jgi:hypothetical protein
MQQIWKKKTHQNNTKKTEYLFVLNIMWKSYLWRKRGQKYASFKAKTQNETKHFFTSATGQTKKKWN